MLKTEGESMTGNDVERRPKARPTPRRRVKPRWYYPVGVIVLAILAWEIVVDVANVPEYIICKPSEVVAEFIDRPGYYLEHLWATLIATVAGLALGVLVAVLLALAMSYIPVFEYSVYPIIVTSQAVPKVALAPLFIIWFGFGISSKILMAFLICFFPLVIDTLSGLKSVNPDYVRMVRSMGASEWDVARRIKIPSALPHFFAGLKVASAFAMVGAVVGEFTGASEGLGYVIVQSQSTLNVQGVFASVVLLSIVGILLFYAVALVERLVIPWHASVRPVGG